jgi:hypothetical protein
MPDQTLDDLERLRTDDVLAVIGGEQRCNFPGVRQLVERLRLEADRRRHHGLVAALGHQADDGGRVDAAAQEGAERNFALQPQSHGIVQQLGHPLRRSAGIGLLSERQIPVPVHLHAAGIGDERVSRQQLASLPEDRFVARDVEK